MTESRWVTRDGSNNIIAVYANEQSQGQEKLTDEHPDVLAFFAPPPPPTKAERIARITGGNDVQEVMFKMFFKLHNRLQVLEGKAPVTVNQFLTFLESELP